MNETNITDVVLAVYLTDHKLGLPQFLIVGNVVVAHFTLTDLEDSTVAIKLNLNILKLFGIDLFKFQNKSILRNFKRTEVLNAPLKVTVL